MQKNKNNLNLILAFEGLISKDVGIAGGKGASLGEMFRAGIPVPPGFVILSPAFEKFLKETDLNVEIDAVLETVNHKEMHTIENASEKIKALILAAEMPKDVVKIIQKFFKKLGARYVAVRSSATAEDSASAAWAGQLESYLNTTGENLLENVKKCWASLFTPRAIFYRFEKDLHKQKISVAVVVQKMVESEKSGIAFSVHPVTQDRNQLIIEAGFGLGEAIVSGQITPDSYVVEKQPRRIIDKNVQTQSKGLYRAENGGNEWRDVPKEQGEKQVLSDKEILELSELILKIENHYNFPRDVEWVFENRKFCIVQSRPITTLDKERGYAKRLSKFDVDTLVKKYNLKLGVLRDMPLLTMSCIAHGYSLMEKRFGVSYSVVAAFGFDGKFHSLISEGEIVDKMRRIVKESHPNIVDKVLSPANKILEKSIKQLGEIEFLVESKPSDFVLSLADLYSNYFSCLGIYNCFWRYIGDGCDVDLTDEQIKLIGQNRDEAARFYPKPENLLKVATDKIGKQYGFNGDLIRYFLYSEIKNRDSLVPNSLEQKFLEQRRKKYFYLYLQSDQSEKVITEPDVIYYIEKKYYSIDDKDSNIIKGSPAFSGKVRGNVLNLMETKIDKTNKIPTETILVTSMTHPDDVPLIKKSKAVVTDEGGILSHAAITARELKIPCVIGTKFATKMLKNGTLVEVDADAGVVRVLG